MGATAAEISSAKIQSSFSVTETLKDAVGAGTTTTVTSTALNPAQTEYTLTSDPPGKYYSSDTLALVAGAATIDLTSLPGLQATIDGTGLKVQAFRIRGAAGNSALTISPGAANPYTMFGAGNDLEYPADCALAFQFEFDETLADIAAGAKEIDLAGTGTEQFQIEFILG